METITNDHELVGRYVVEDSEEAFKELFRKYFPLVYGAARRITRDSDLACDVAQCVFHQFARKAGSLQRDTYLAGWFYKASVFEASKVVRSECRRRNREVEAGTLLDASSFPDLVASDGISMEDQLDQAIANLGHDDRNLVLLRFWHGMSARQMGRLLGLTESAAQKRLTRALGKLRSQVVFNGGLPDLAAITGLLPVMLKKTAASGPATKVSYFLNAALNERKVSWIGRMESVLNKVFHLHRTTIASALIVLNTLLWAGLYQPAQEVWQSSPGIASSITLVNGWRNLSMGLAFVVDASFVRLGAYPASGSGSGSGSCR